MTTCCNGHGDYAGCESIPALTRPTYFFGQMLGQPEFRAEHDYLARKLELVTRYGIGHGVACGLNVTFEHRRRVDCPSDKPTHEWWLLIAPGIAIDCAGKLIVVRQPVERRLTDLLSVASKPSGLVGDAPPPPGVPEKPGTKSSVLHDEISAGESTRYWVAVCFAERAAYPSRPLAVDACDPCSPDVFARYCDGVEVTLKTAAPVDECDSCCGACASGVLLASFVAPSDLAAADAVIDLRRPLGRRLTTIDSVNWQHGKSYDEVVTREQLGDPGRGLVVRFSGAVQPSTLQVRGVVEVEVLEGGSEPSARTYYPGISVEPFEFDPKTGGATAVRIVFDQGRDGDGPQVSQRDRFLVRLRCDHILDMCCRAVDAMHFGGRVSHKPDPGDSSTFVPWKATASPPTAEAAATSEAASTSEAPVECAPDDHIQTIPDPCVGNVFRAAHQLGNGTEGGIFESWFFVKGKK
jgi:hypothetical protein